MGIRIAKWQRRTTKREEAKKRQEARDKRSALQQLHLLDKKFGVGQGAKRERARLEKLATTKA